MAASWIILLSVLGADALQVQSATGRMEAAAADLSVEPSSRRTVLVAGGAGFMGFHLSQKLQSAGWQVIALDNFDPYYSVELKRERAKRLVKAGVMVLEGSLCDSDLLAELFAAYSLYAVVNLVGQGGVRHRTSPGYTKVYGYMHSNPQCMQRLLDQARFSPSVRIVYASSSAVYSTPEPPHKYKEADHAVGSPSTFGAEDASTESLAQTYCTLYGMPMTGLRFMSVYGPWGRPDSPYMKFSDAMKNNRNLTVWGDGQILRDWTYVDDAVDAITAAMQRKATTHEIYNVGGGAPSTLLELVNELGSRLLPEREHASLDFIEKPMGEVSRESADISKAQQELAYNPVVSMSTGLSIFADWWKSDDFNEAYMSSGLWTQPYRLAQLNNETAEQEVEDDGNPAMSFLSSTEPFDYSPFLGDLSRNKHVKALHNVSVTPKCGFGNASGLDAAIVSTGRKCEVAVFTAVFDALAQLHQPADIPESMTGCYFAFLDRKTAATVSVTATNTRANGTEWTPILVESPLPFDTAVRNINAVKMLGHKLLADAQYAVFVDAKLQLLMDPKQLVHLLLTKRGAVFGALQHPTRNDAVEEFMESKLLGKIKNPSAMVQLHKYKASLPTFGNLEGNIDSSLMVTDLRDVSLQHLMCNWLNEYNWYPDIDDQVSFPYVLHSLGLYPSNKVYIASRTSDIVQHWRTGKSKIARLVDLEPSYAHSVENKFATKFA